MAALVMTLEDGIENYAVCFSVEEADAGKALFSPAERGQFEALMSPGSSAADRLIGLSMLARKIELVTPEADS